MASGKTKFEWPKELIGLGRLRLFYRIFVVF